MTHFEEACSLMTKQLGRDVVLSLATCLDNRPSVRNVNGFYADGAIYVATYLSSLKMQQVLKNGHVAFCRAGDLSIPFYEGLLEGVGKGVNLGHPKAPENRVIREKLKQVFCDFYDRHVDEESEGTCFLRIDVLSAAAFDGSHKYLVDFEKKQAEKIPLAIE